MSGPTDEPRPDVDQDGERDFQRRRLRGFGTHLLVYFAVMVLLVPLNVLTTPEYPWFLFPMVGWGAPLAIHAAFAMGLFGRSGQ
ncbi:2TM domain-containing protein [Arenibaculum pallidiluteum]|uniref:2TM domain-containing protein n=1 Tax=Arenibaculum pallidiluteum TaxID=2812559 RepID=UPI001A95A459|nr:2TM domain-containing protein [Arenibaculum pallidiluteum]